MAFIPSMGLAAAQAGASLVGGAVGGLLGHKKVSQQQQQKKELIDQLLSSIKGQGAYSNLFNMDEDAFRKSYIDPMKSMYEKQIAPQIQQSYIATGQQHGTGMEDSLTRAGVEMDQLLNQHYMQAKQQADQNKFSAMNTILGAENIPDPQSRWTSMLQGVAGALPSQSFGTSLSNIFANQEDRDASREAYRAKQPRSETYTNY